MGQVKKLPSRERVRPREDGVGGKQEKPPTHAVNVWSRCTKRIKPQDLQRGDTSSTFEFVGADQHRENYCFATVVQVGKRLVRNRHIGQTRQPHGTEPLDQWRSRVPIPSATPKLDEKVGGCHA